MKRDIMRILADWNVWWEKNEVPLNLLGQKRGISDELIDLMELKEIKIIAGVRRSGKSTILYQIIEHLLNTGVPSKNILLLNFEDAALAPQLWKPKKQPQPFDYPPDPKIPKTKSNPKPLSADPSKHTQFRTYSTL